MHTIVNFDLYCRICIRSIHACICFVQSMFCSSKNCWTHSSRVVKCRATKLYQSVVCIRRCWPVVVIQCESRYCPERNQAANHVCLWVVLHFMVWLICCLGLTYHTHFREYMKCILPRMEPYVFTEVTLIKRIES